MSSTLTQKLQRNLYLKAHLAELEALTGRTVRVDELSSIEQFEARRQVGRQKYVGQPVTACEIPFTDRTSERFKGFIQRLKEANSSPIYVVTPHADVCGELLVSSLDEIKFDFDFEINEDGILIFPTSDFEDRLLLDFSNTSTGEQVMRVETQGKNWVKVTY